MKNKKWISITIIFIALVNVFATDISTLLETARGNYASGNLDKAIEQVDQAKKLLEAEQLIKDTSNYIEIKSWDVITLKPETYIRQKVKLVETFYGVEGKNEINVGFKLCTFEPPLIDKLLEMEKWKKYTFFGTINPPRYNGGSPVFHVEKISD